MEADRGAPVYEAAEAVVSAPPEVVWDTLTDLSSWPRWMPGVQSVRVDGPLAVGTTFEWKAGPGTIKSKILEAERPRSVGWEGHTLGITALHAWRMEAQGGGTHVFTEESWAGLLPRVLGKLMCKTVRKALDDWLPALKAEAERRASPH